MHKPDTRVWTGARRPTPQGMLALLFAGVILLGAVVIPLDLSPAGRSPRGEPGVAQQQEHVSEVLAAVRGTQPLACRLAVRALENRWGRDQGDVPGPESIGVAGDAAFEWATSGEVTAAAVSALKAALADPDGCVPRIAAVLLGHARDVNLAAELRTELASANPTTRQAALLAIGYAGSRADVPAASAALRDREYTVRLAAVWALGRIGDPAAVAPLLEILKAADPGLRAAAATALGSTESTEAVPALAAVLGSDSDARVRRAAAAALGRIEQ